MESKYQFTEKCPKHELFVKNESTGLYEKKLVKGVTPFGKQTGVLTEDKLSDAIVDFLYEKHSLETPYKEYITKKDKK